MSRGNLDYVVNSISLGKHIVILVLNKICIVNPLIRYRHLPCSLLGSIRSAKCKITLHKHLSNTAILTFTWENAVNTIIQDSAWGS